MTRKAGIRDVAREANVSVGTVSKVFNPASSANIRISDATRERVRAAAAKLNYSANYGAALLRGQSSRTIGFIVNLPDEYGFTQLSDYQQRILNGLSAAAGEAGYHLLLITGGDYRSFLEIKRIDALVMISFRLVNNSGADEMLGMFRSFNERNYPYVVINNTCDALPVPAINVDNRYGMKLVAERILGRGYRSIGFVGEQTPNPQGHHCERAAALAEFLAGTGVEFPPELCLNGIGKGIEPSPRIGEFSQMDGIAALRFLHREKKVPRCLVCGNDTIAQGVLCAAAELGIKVPDELAVIGFDDMPGCAYFVPPLSTVNQPLEEFGRKAFAYVVRKMAEPEYFAQYSIEPTFTERVSG